MTMTAITESVYIETSMVSYLTARPSNNLIMMANQEVTLRSTQFSRRYQPVKYRK